MIPIDGNTAAKITKVYFKNAKEVVVTESNINLSEYGIPYRLEDRFC